MINILSNIFKRQITNSFLVTEEIAGFVISTGDITTIELINNEVTYNKTDTESSSVGKQFSISISGENFIATQFNSITPEISVIDNNGNTTYVSNGIATFQVIAEDIQNNRKRGYITSIAVNTTPETVTTRELISFESGSLAYHIQTGMAAKIANTTSSDTTRNIFTTKDFTTPNFIRNTGCWLTGVSGLNAISPARFNVSSAYNSPVGVVISPLHIYAVKHHTPAIGQGLRFITTDNQIINRTIIDKQDASINDTSILILDSALPSDIGFLKVMPENFFVNYLPTATYEAWGSNIIPNFLGKMIPAICFNQDERAYIKDLNNVITNGWHVTNSLWHPTWSFTVRNGDSGKPVFLLINNELVLLGGWTAINFGYQINQNITEINTIMETLSNNNSKTVYSLTEYDLTQFLAYNA